MTTVTITIENGERKRTRVVSLERHPDEAGAWVVTSYVQRINADADLYDIEGQWPISDQQAARIQLRIKAKGSMRDLLAEEGL